MDITGRKTAEEALLRLNIKLDRRVLVHSAPVAVAKKEYGAHCAADVFF